MRTSFWTKLLDLVSPRTCAVCGRRLKAEESVLCGICLFRMPLTHLWDTPYDNPMARLFWGRFAVERAAALFFFKPHNELANAIYTLKYRNQPHVGQNLGRMAARRMGESGFFEGIDAIVPMPITRRRRWQRGYNQSEEIARGVSQATGLPLCTKAVRRTHFAQSQTRLSRLERADNVADAFRLADSQAVSGKHLLLVDDIVTTGATVTACARELCKAGGVKVSIMALGLTKT